MSKLFYIYNLWILFWEIFHMQYLRQTRDEAYTFPSSSHNLEIEDGRYIHYNKEEQHNRHCKVGNMQMVEDEYHFWLVCPVASNLWRKRLPFYYYRWPSRYKFIQSNLNSSNTDGSFTMAYSNSFLSPYEILPIAQENKYLGKFSYSIMKLYVVCTH